MPVRVMPRPSAFRGNSSGPTSRGGSWRAVPELPETETIARDLHAAIAGERITDVTVTHADVLREVTPRALRARVTGTTIDRVWRRAKLVVLDLSSGDRIVVQPRFTGALLIDAGDLPPAERRYSAIAFALIPNPQSRIPNPQSPVPNPQSPNPQTPDPHPPTPNPHSPIPNPQSPIPNPQSPVPNPQSPVPNPQSPIPNPQSPIPN